MSHSTELVAILDAGGQYAKVIDRKVRELNVCTEIVSLDISTEQLTSKGFKAIIISGGPESVYNDSLKYDPKLLDLGLPILGICFGMQMIAYASGGTVEKKSEREDGQYSITVSTASPLFAHLSEKQLVLLTHGDSVASVGNGYQVIAKSGDLISAISNQEKNIYGVQFHPEVDLTENGKQIFKNFLFEVCKLTGDFNRSSRKEQAIQEIKHVVGDKKVLMMASGGVDSTVCTALLHCALPKDQIIALHIDNGFMRKNESSKVKTALNAIGIDLLVVDGSQEFYNGKSSEEAAKLAEETNPELKRKIIGDVFVQIAQREINKLGLNPDDVILAQGTLRPDMIESGSLDVSKHAAVIKTHHNDTFLVRQLRAKGQVIEPLKDYHKDEVRELGIDIGLPVELVMRHPFPGPGLSVRIICTREPFMDHSFEKTNSILRQIVSNDGMPEIEQTIQSSLRKEEGPILLQIREQKNIVATLLPFKTVGVQGDGRTYSYPCSLTTSDGSQNWEHLFLLAKLIPRISHNINRIIYLFGDAIHGPITKVTATQCTPDVIRTLQEADAVVTSALYDSNEMGCVAQAPVIIFPIGSNGKRSIAFRPIVTNDFMTGIAAIPEKHIKTSTIESIHKKIIEMDGIDRFAYDLTSKPPGTIEWE